MYETRMMKMVKKTMVKKIQTLKYKEKLERKIKRRYKINFLLYLNSAHIISRNYHEDKYIIF